MSGFYIGVDGKARKVNGAYIGVDGVARKVKKGYIGDENGIARLCWIANPFDPVFANNTWEEIAVACQTRSVPDEWSVGDQKTMTINGVDYVVDIIGKNHDDYADGSGKAPLTFQFHDCYATKYSMNNTVSNNGGWASCFMKRFHLPSILEVMPTEVKTAIREVNKLTSKGLKSSTIDTTIDKLFLLSEVEIFDTANMSFSGEGHQYKYYADGNSASKKIVNASSAVGWWLRSPVTANDARFAVVTLNGDYASQGNADSEYGVSFAFCF